MAQSVSDTCEEVLLPNAGVAQPTHADSVAALSTPFAWWQQAEARRVFIDLYGRLMTASGAMRPRCVLVCGASTGDGASTTAAGLAFAAAGQGSGRVLLIDGNIHSPSMPEMFGLNAEMPGLGSLLGNSPAIEALCTPTRIPGLFLMSAGTVPGNHLRLLDPPRLRGLLDALPSEFRLVILDGPAVNSYPESILYASQVDRVLFIVRARTTRGPVAAQALSRLSAAGGAQTDVVLNRRTYTIPQAIYRRL